MNLSPAFLLASLVISSIGFVAFVYGKRQSRMPQMAVGGALLIYPYFVSNVALMALIAVLLLGILYLAVRAGW